MSSKPAAGRATRAGQRQRKSPPEEDGTNAPAEVNIDRFVLAARERSRRRRRRRRVEEVVVEAGGGRPGRLVDVVALVTAEFHFAVNEG